MRYTPCKTSNEKTEVSVPEDDTPDTLTEDADKKAASHETPKSDMSTQDQALESIGMYLR